MNFAVLGAGAIGAYVGACLARGGETVTLVARGPHLAAMRENGVRVYSPLGDFVEHPDTTDDLAAIGDAEVVLVALKAYSLPELAPTIGAALAPGATAVFAQNGVPWWYFHFYDGPLAGTVLESTDPGGVIVGSIPPESVLGCVVYCSTEIVEPGVIRHIEGTRFSLGEPDCSVSERATAISKAFSAGGLKAPVDANLRDQIWLKLLGNVAFNPLSALTGATLGELAKVADLLREVFGECAAVAEQLGAKLGVSLERRLQAGLAVGDHKTSMLQDLELGRRLELDCMSGAVVELAGLLGVAVPHIETLHRAASLLDRVRRG